MMRVLVIISAILTIFTGATSGAGPVDARDCARILYAHVGEHERHLVNIALLPLVLDGRTSARILVHVYVRSQPPTYFAFDNLGLGAGLPGVAIPSQFTILRDNGVFAVLTGSRDGVVERAADLQATYGEQNVTFQVLQTEGPGRGVSWERGTKLIEMSGPGAERVLADLEASDVRAATIYDVDHNTGYFTVTNDQVAEISDKELGMLGIRMSETFDRANFKKGPQAYHGNGFTIFSKDAFHRLQKFNDIVNHPPLDRSSPLLAALDQCVGPVCSAPADIPPALAAPAAPAALHAVVPALSPEAWIDNLGKVASFRDVLFGAKAWHDRWVDAGRIPLSERLNAPSSKRFALNILTALWTYLLPNHTVPDLKFSDSASNNALGGGSLKAASDIEAAWANFYVAYQRHQAELGATATAIMTSSAAPVPDAAPAPTDALTVGGVTMSMKEFAAQAERAANAVIEAANERAAAAEQMATRERVAFAERTAAANRAVSDAEARAAAAQREVEQLRATMATERAAVEERLVTALAARGVVEAAPAPAVAAVSSAPAAPVTAKPVVKKPTPKEAPAPAPAPAPKPALPPASTIRAPATPAVLDDVVDLDDPTIPIAVQRQIIAFVERVARVSPPLRSELFKDALVTIFKAVVSEIPFERYKVALTSLDETAFSRLRGTLLANAAARDITVQDDLHHAWNDFRHVLGLAPVKGNLTAERADETIRAFEALRSVIGKRTIRLPAKATITVPASTEATAAVELGLTSDQIKRMVTTWHGISFENLRSTRGGRWTIFFAAQGRADIKVEGQAYLATIEDNEVTHFEANEIAFKDFLVEVSKTSNMQDMEVPVSFPYLDQRNIVILVEPWKQVQLQFMRNLTPSQVIGILRRGKLSAQWDNAVLQVNDPFTTQDWVLTVEEKSRGRFVLKNIFPSKKDAR